MPLVVNRIGEQRKKKWRCRLNEQEWLVIRTHKDQGLKAVSLSNPIGEALHIFPYQDPPRGHIDVDDGHGQKIGTKIISNFKIGSVPVGTTSPGWFSKGGTPYAKVIPLSPELREIVVWSGPGTVWATSKQAGYLGYMLYSD
jgi:hypothetical protein